MDNPYTVIVYSWEAKGGFRDCPTREEAERYAAEALADPAVSHAPIIETVDETPTF